MNFAIDSYYFANIFFYSIFWSPSICQHQGIIKNPSAASHIVLSSGATPEKIADEYYISTRFVGSFPDQKHLLVQSNDKIIYWTH